MVKKIVLVIFILTIVSGLSSLSYAYQATQLSDQELDNICAGGFNIDINAARAFRSAVLSQNNITSIASIKGNVTHTSITSSNHASIANAVIPALDQSNISAVIAKAGDIVGAIIKNINDVDANNTAPNASVNTFSSKTSNFLDQNNVALAVALDGNVKNTTINNVNSATLNNAGNSSPINESNIAIVVAGGVVENTSITNSNVAKVDNVKVSSSGGLKVSYLKNGKLTDFKFKNSSNVSQRSLTVVVAGIKNKLSKKANIADTIRTLTNFH